MIHRAWWKVFLSQSTMFSCQIVLYFVIFASSHLLLAQGDDVVGCGGFVQSEVDINYSLVQVTYQVLKTSKIDAVYSLS